MMSTLRWTILVTLTALFLVSPSFGQANRQTTWQSAGATPPASAVAPVRGTPEGTAAPAPPEANHPSRTVRATPGQGALPNDHGQLWREYDISPYTLQVATTNRPEQAIIDWILQETGYEAWHTEPLAVLSANRRTLYVYHTPEMQQLVADVVDRFVSNDVDACDFSLRVITVAKPNWRAHAQQYLEAVPVQTPGVQAWILQREAAVNLLAELGRRVDYREHSSSQQMVSNGQSTVVSSMRTQSYIRDVRLTGTAWPGYQQETALVDDGFSLEFSPLLSTDRATIDAIVKCQIDQLEKMVPVMVDVPTTVTPRQRARIEVPQMGHFQLHERFRWPENKVLLIEMGMIPLPAASESKSLVPGLPIPGMGGSEGRGDLLVFIEAKRPAPAVTPVAKRTTQPY